MASIGRIFVVQHSHTDIGYTHGQGRILAWHVDYIRQALDLCEKHQDFRWQCETTYPVEHFLKTASGADIARLKAAIAGGQIAVSANFLQFTELLDGEMLQTIAQRSADVIRSLGTEPKAAMTADINGVPLAYGRGLADAGVQVIVTQIHPHHGDSILGKRMAAFKWDLGNGQSIKVFNNDHYHTGNELGLSPGGSTNYVNFSQGPLPITDAGFVERVEAYISKIDPEWPLDFLVFTCSGLITDNSCPSASVLHRIQVWNAAHPEMPMVMATLDAVADALDGVELPTLAGDWLDWWNDGTAGDPEGTMMFRHAQRERHAIAKLDPNVDLAELDLNLALYAEHTFGHSASVHRPWNRLAQQLHTRKVGFAAQAADLAEVLADEAVRNQGGAPVQADDRPLVFEVRNLGDEPFQGLVEFEWDGCESVRWGLGSNLEVVNEATGSAEVSQRCASLRGPSLAVYAEMTPGESRRYSIRNAPLSAGVHPHITRFPDTGTDLGQPRAASLGETFKAGQLALVWQDGALGWFLDGKSLESPFELVRTVEPGPISANPACEIRQKLGRNRVSASVEISRSSAGPVEVVEQGPLFTILRQRLSCPGFEFIEQEYKVIPECGTVDVATRMHKIGTWMPENVYQTLPVVEGAELFVDRGWKMRPWKDLLPGTLTDYMGVQQGISWEGLGSPLTVELRDAHLVQFGPIAFGERLRMGDPRLPAVPDQVSAWLMCSTWETNFSPELGGFYEFRASLRAAARESRRSIAIYRI
ncbi:MAG: hypothetical protein JST40_07740 [Armatimonadetes bacterium]|nr:hypothetical protein [Armatimonadota bacterium]